jgi:hypothetical protein
VAFERKNLLRASMVVASMEGSTRDTLSIFQDQLMVLPWRWMVNGAYWSECSGDWLPVL